MKNTLPREEIVKVDDLSVDGDNPNIMTEKQRKALQSSIEKYGFLIPIITNKGLVIADGQHRWEVAKDMGMKEVKIIRLPVEDVDRRLLRQVLNKLRGEHEKDKDMGEYKKILSMLDDPTLARALLPDEDITGIMRKLELAEKKDSLDVEKAYDNPKYEVKRGDVWQLGDHRLMCGDSINTGDVKTLMQGTHAHMVFTDPPYNLQWTGRGQEKKGLVKKKWRAFAYDHATNKEYTEFLRKFIIILRDMLMLEGSYYICIDWRQYPLLASLLTKQVFVDELIVWDKTFIKMGSKYRNQHELIAMGYKEREDGDLGYNEDHELISFGANGKKVSRWWGGRKESNVWSIITDPSFSYKHPTQKPVELAARAIKNSSQPDEVVLDFFGGSGSTLIACEQEKRTCRIMEIDPRYCSVIIERWEEFTGKKGEKQ